MTISTSTSNDRSRLADYLSGAGRRVDEALRRYLPEESDDPAAACPARLAAAMRYSVLGGGKRLRPLLCLMAAEACGAEPEAALPAACALEMVHTYSLIHDDLPAMDDDDLRRGRPTCHKAFDEATAILAGDGLLTLAFEVLARHIRPAEAAVGCVRALAEAAGPAGMVGGPDGRPPGRGADRRHRSRRSRRSTAARPGPCSGPRCGWGRSSPGPTRDALQALDVYGQAVGPGVPDRRRPARRPGGRGQAGQAGRQGFRAREVDLSRLPRVSRGAASGRGNSPTRRSRRWRPLGTRGDRLRALALDLLERDR